MKNYLKYLAVLPLVFSCKKDDNNGPSPIDSSALEFKKVSTFVNGANDDEGYAEISAYDADSKNLFIVNPNDSEISVWNLENLSNPKEGSAISLNGTPNSVATHNGILAVAVENSNKQANGEIVTYDASTLVKKNTYTAGALPDMVTFSPNGKYLISANEGEPNGEYTVDPEGSLTVVNLKDNTVNQLDFTKFNNSIIGNEFRVFGPGASLAEDVEPEYIAVSDDSKYAYVALQENNGLAIVDLDNLVITELVGLGVKDYNNPSNTLDASNKDDKPGNFKNWPVYGFYMPDAITYTKVNGTGYIISANEGDARDYDGYSEEDRVKDLTLDPTAFPNAEELQKDENLGRLKTTYANGDTDGDDDYDKIYCYGGRSFSIWDTNGALVYDSGDQIGKTTFDLNSSVFNDDEGEADGRSDDKGAEPEAVTTLKIEGTTLLFVGLERTGGVMVYDITNPTSPVFVEWLYDSMDIAPEGLITIPASESPNGKNLVVVTNEVSNTISIYQIN